MEVADLRVKFSTDGVAMVRRDVQGVDHDIQGVDRSSRSAGGSLGNLIKIGAGFAIGAGIFEGARGMLMLNANAEQAKMSLETVTGSQEKANALFKDLQEFAKSTPFEFPELVNASINLESFGLKTNEWITTIGDTASAMGKDVDQVTQAVLDAQTGQYERLKELGIMTQVEGDKVKFRYMKDGKEIVETVDKNNQEMINSTIQGIWNSKYDGAMEKQSQSFLGQWSTLKDNFSMTMMSMTEGIFSATRGALSFFNDVFSVGWQQAVDNAFGDSTFGNALSNIGTFVSGIVEAFGEGSSVQDIVDKMPAEWQGFAEPILTFFDSLGDVWSRFRSSGFMAGIGQLGAELKVIAEAGIDLGVIAVKATFELAGDLAGNAWERIKQLAGFSNPDGTAGPGTKTFDVSVGTVLVTIGEMAVKSITGWASTAVADIQTWLDTNELSGFTQAIKIDSLDPSIDALALGNYSLAVEELINADPIKVTPKIELNIQDAVANWVKDKEDEASGWFTDVPGLLLKGIIAGFVVMNPFAAAAAWITKNILPDGLRVLRATVKGVFDGLLREPDYFDVSSGRMVQGEGFGADLIDNLVTFFTDLPGDVVEAVGALKIDIPEPELPDWLDEPYDWVKGPIDGLILVIQTGANGLRAAWQDLQFWKGQTEELPPSQDPRRYESAPSSNGFMLDGEPVNELPAVGSGPQTATFTTVFDADTGPLATAYTEAFGWGETFAAQEFVATFDADTGPAAIAYTSAFGWGDTWANTTFSARFSVDLSPLEGALQRVREIAQDISDLLPSSPAKKGPLARNVSFKYIADALEDSMGRMGDITSRGLSALMGPGISPLRVSATSNESSSNGGGTTIVIQKGAYVGSGAARELKAMAATGAAKVVDKRFASRGYSGAKL